MWEHLGVAIGGGLVSLGVAWAKLVPRLVTREEVAQMIEKQPLHITVGWITKMVESQGVDLKAICHEMKGMREDVGRLTALLERREG